MATNEGPQEPDSSVWPEMLVIADKYKEAMALAFLAALVNYKKKINKKNLLLAVKSKDSNLVLSILDIDKIDIKKLENVASRITQETIQLLSNKYNWNIDPKNEAIHAYIRDYVGDQIVQINKNTQDAIKNLVEDAWNKGENADILARRIKENIGLDPRRMKALENYRRYVENSENVKRLKTQEAKDKFVEKYVQKYEQRLLRARGDMIARTESINTVNEGSYAMYNQAANQGYIDKSKYVMEWIVTPDDRLCSNCARMYRQFAPIGGSFSNGKRCPTLHPDCRCCIVCRKIENISELNFSPPEITKPKTRSLKPKLPKV